MNFLIQRYEIYFYLLGYVHPKCVYTYKEKKNEYR